MANVPLKSIKFPSLPDTYTFTQLSSDLATANKAADSKEVGDAIAAVTADISDLSSDVDGLEHDASKTPQTIDSDAEDVDLDVTDEEGNVILRLEDGHIKTKEFDSEQALSDIAGKQDALTFDNEPTSGSNNPVKSGGIYSSVSKFPNTMLSNANGVDLDVTDDDGNVILRLADGHIKTKEFDSSAIGVDSARAKPTDAAAGIFDIVDGGGNVILRLENGYIKTKKTDNTNPFEVPSYYFPYLDQKCERIKQLLEASGGDAFIFCTDQHFNQGNAGQSFKLINYVANKCRITKLFMGGDLTDGWDAEHSDEFRRAIDGRYYFINGNHEYMRQGSTAEKLAYLNEALADNLQMGDYLRNYYYVDNPKKQMRYIVLNGFDEDSGTWKQGYEADQMTWLTTVAMDIPTGWHMIILSHIFYSCASMTDPTLGRNAWAEHVLDTIDEQANASSVLCIVCGHTHVDGIGSTTGGIPVLITACDKNKRYNPDAGYEWWLVNRVDGTVWEQLFDVCVVDLTNSKITAVRIGGFSTGDNDDDEELFEIGERVINL